MKRRKTALLVDSCTDVPDEIREKYPIYIVPLMVHYPDGSEYRSGIDITTEEIYARMPEELPKTSAPTQEAIHDVFQQIRRDGYTQVLAVTISANISGTCNAIRLVAEDFPDLDTRVVDTKNIAIGAGMTAVRAAEVIDEDRLDMDALEEAIRTVAEHTKVYFCVRTLEYLRKGGRIGLVASALGTAFQLKPVITCNQDGVYTTVKKARGFKRAVELAMSCVEQHLAGAKRYRIAVADGGVPEEGDGVMAEVRRRLPSGDMYFRGSLSAVLAVHTGPGLIGMVAQTLD